MAGLPKQDLGRQLGEKGRVPFLPDVAFIIRFEIIFPFVRGGLVHIYPSLMFRFGVGLIFNHQIYIFPIVYKHCSVLHGEDVDESFS